MFDSEFEKTYQDSLAISAITNADGRLNLTQLSLSLLQCTSIKIAIESMQLRSSNFEADFKLLLQIDNVVREIPSANYPNLTQQTERVIQRAIIAKQERRTEKNVTALDVMLSVLGEFESHVAINLIELGLTREKVDSYIRSYAIKSSSPLDYYKDGKVIKRKRLFKRLVKVVPITLFVLIAIIYFVKTYPIYK
jgi:hypothetical protein